MASKQWVCLGWNNPHFWGPHNSIYNHRAPLTVISFFSPSFLTFDSHRNFKKFHASLPKRKKSSEKWKAPKVFFKSGILGVGKSTFATSLSLRGLLKDYTRWAPTIVINGATTPVSRVIFTPVTHWFHAIYKGPHVTTFVTILVLNTSKTSRKKKHVTTRAWENTYLEDHPS